MPFELIIALIIVGVLVIAFFVTSVLRTANATKIANEEAEAATAESNLAEETKAEPINETAEEPVADKEPEAPVVIGDVDEKTKLQIKRVPFSEKLAAQPDEVQGYFNDIYNEFISYKKVHARVSKKCVSFRFGRQILAKLFIKGKTMKLALALDVNEFGEKTYFQKDMSAVKSYADVPFTVKVKSGRAAKRAKELVNAVAEKNGAVKKAKFVPVNAMVEIKANEKK